MGQKLFVALYIVGVDALDLSQGIFNAATIVQMGAVVELISVPRRYRQNFNVVLDAAVKQFEQLIEKKWGGNHRRAGIEDEAVLGKSLGSAAELV